MTTKWVKINIIDDTFTSRTTIRKAHDMDVAGRQELTGCDIYTDFYPSKEAALIAHEDEDDGDPKNELKIIEE